MTHRISSSFPARGKRPPATVPHARGRAGAFASVMLVQLAMALLLGLSAHHAPPNPEPGIRPREAVEIGLPHRRGDVARELVPRATHAPQTRAGSGASPFAAERWDLAALSSSVEPVEAAAPDPRGARRPAYYANAPPRSGRPST